MQPTRQLRHAELHIGDEDRDRAPGRYDGHDAKSPSSPLPRRLDNQPLHISALPDPAKRSLSRVLSMFAYLRPLRNRRIHTTRALALRDVLLRSIGEYLGASGLVRRGVAVLKYRRARLVADVTESRKSVVGNNKERAYFRRQCRIDQHELGTHDLKRIAKETIGCRSHGKCIGNASVAGLTSMA